MLKYFREGNLTLKGTGSGRPGLLLKLMNRGLPGVRIGAAGTKHPQKYLGPPPISVRIKGGLRLIACTSVLTASI